MNVVIVCTNCKKPLKIPAEGLGKKVRCPACKTVFVGQRDEFKPRPAGEDNETLAFPPPPVARPPANDAMLADEDAPRPESSGSSIIDPITDVSDASEVPAPQPKRATPPPKKKSKLLLILVLLFIFAGLPILGCGGLFVVFGTSVFWLVDRQATPSGMDQKPDHRTEPTVRVTKDNEPPKADDKTEPIKPPADKSEPVKPPDDKTQPVKPVHSALEEEIKNAAEGVKLVPLDLEIGGVPFTVQAPEGATVAPGINDYHKFLVKGDTFKLGVSVGRFNAAASKAFWSSKEFNYPLRATLLDVKDLLVTEHSGAIGSTDLSFHTVANTTLGHFDFRLESEWYNEQFKAFGRKDVLLMAYCARTAKLNAAYKAPNSPEALMKFGMSVDKNGDGKYATVSCGGPCSDATLPLIVKLAPDAESLDLGGAQISDEGLKTIGQLKKLHVLWLPQTGPETLMDGSGLVYLKDLKQLEELHLDNTGAKGENLAPLASLTGLKRLTLSANRITGPGLEHLRPLTNLTQLTLSQQPLDDAGLANLAGLTGLTELELQNIAATGPGFAALKGMTELQSLNLDSTPITDEGVRHLAALKKLQTLTLSGTKITDAGLAALKDLKALGFLDLSQTAVTGTGFANFPKMEALTGLSLNETKFSDGGSKNLDKFPKLTSLELGKTAVTGAGFPDLGSLTQLQFVNLVDAPLTDAGLGRLATCKAVTRLTLDRTKITDGAWPHLKGFENLQALQCGETAVTGVGAAALQSSKKLTDLNLYKTKFTDAGVAQLKGVTSLISLHLDETAVSDAGLEGVKGLTNLEALTLNKTTVTDRGLDHLKELKKLTSLSVYETKVTKAGADKLKKALPELEVYRADE